MVMQPALKRGFTVRLTIKNSVFSIPTLGIPQCLLAGSGSGSSHLELSTSSTSSGRRWLPASYASSWRLSDQATGSRFKQISLLYRNHPFGGTRMTMEPPKNSCPPPSPSGVASYTVIFFFHIAIIAH